VLLPTIGREKSFRLNLYVLAALVVGVLVAVAVNAAGGGTEKQAASATTQPASQPAAAALAAVGVPLPTPPPPPAPDVLTQAERIYRYLLFGLLGGLVLLITITVLKSPSRTTRRLSTHTDAAQEPVPAAADAEAPNAAAVYSRGHSEGGYDASDTGWIRRWQRQHQTRLGLLFVVLIGAVLLTAIHVVGGGQNDDKRVAYRAAVRAAHRDAERVVQLAGGAGGIPPQGAVWLLRNDAATQGPKLFARNCASCHRFDGHDGLGQPVKDPQSAPDLAQFASRTWVEGLLDPKQVDSARYFGPNMKAHAGKMVEFVKEEVAQATDAKDRQELHTIVLALSAEANLPAQRESDRSDAGAIEAGRVAFKESVLECAQCHAWRGEKPSLGGASRGPDLTGYGSRQWLVDFIKNPQHPRFYPGDKNDRMPLYGEQKILDERSIGLIADWIRGDAGGESGSPGAAAEPTAAPAATAQTAPATNPAAALATAPTTFPAPAPSTTPAPPPDLAPAPVPAPTPPKSETMPTVPKPAEAKPAETKPAESKPAESKPPEAPAEKSPIETEFELPAPAK